jgi:peptidoglycan/LPS O-acetylase OafA/YrhL
MAAIRPVLTSLQVVRGLAASMVVLHHTLRAVIATIQTENIPDQILTPSPAFVQFGAAGVDIFFVLSGFLMVMIAAGKDWEVRPSEFLKNRLVRVWPLYATISLVSLSAAVAKSIKSGELAYNLHPLRIASIFFIPSYDQDGRLQPIIGPGWTLIYEVMFYAMFAVALLAPKRMLLPTLCGLIAATFLIGHSFDQGLIRELFGNDLLFEFIMGALLAYGVHRLEVAKVLPWVISSAVIVLIADWQGADLPRSVAYGIPSTSVFACALAMENQIKWPRFLKALGDASYSLYLIHMLIVGQFANRLLNMMAKIQPAENFALWSSVIGTLMIAIIAAFVCHRYLEKPLIRIAQGLLAGRAAVRARGSARAQSL